MRARLFVVAAIVVAGPFLRAMDIPTAKADVTIVNDRFEPREGVSNIKLAVGDFNGDGNDDFAVSLVDSDLLITEVNVVLGGASAVGLVQATALRILTPAPFQQRTSKQIGFGDIDNDGKDDLFIAMEPPNKPGMAILFGRALPQGVQTTIDLNSSEPDVMMEDSFLGIITADLSFAVAEYTGDEYKDLLVGNPISQGFVSLIPGRDRESFSRILDPSAYPQVRRIIGPYNSGLGKTVFFGNVIGNSAPDLILSAPYSDLDGRTNAGKVFVFDGSQALPPVFDLGTSSSTAEIRGASLLHQLYCSGVGDVNGDGRDDLLLNLNIINNFAVLDGAWLATHPVIDLNPASLYYVPVTTFSTVLDYSKGLGGDFDGDGLKDIFLGRSNTIQLLPTSEVVGWPSFPPTLESPWTFQSETGYIRNAAFGDFNNDGIDDLVMAEEAHAQEYWGAFHIIYGFIPLKAPTLQLAQRTPNTPRVNVTLAVQGNPTEMKLSGDIVDDFKDQWIPYGVSHTVTLSPAAGPKTVNAVFRNPFKRESEIASDRVTLTVENQETKIESNLITRDQSALINYSLTAPGRLKASVFTRSGQKVVDLLDEDRAAGFWPIQWDGTNREHRRVAPGVYVLAVTTGDQQVRTKILVKE
ncbi:MAG: VCBS repeat-containing protein [Elusimicrobia bacterium]|nr:VCBS repeat-containing protein [Elusimicrobiota bacterium]